MSATVLYKILALFPFISSNAITGKTMFRLCLCKSVKMGNCCASRDHAAPEPRKTTTEGQTPPKVPSEELSGSTVPAPTVDPAKIEEAEKLRKKLAEKKALGDKLSSELETQTSTNESLGE
jgi:hypothetical protein